MRSSHNCKTTPEQRYELLREHVVNGRAAGSKLAISMGLDRGYAWLLASRLGYRPQIRPIPTGRKWVNA